MKITHSQWKRATQISWIATACLFLTSCSLSSLPTWIQDAESILPLIGSSISTILTFISLLSGKTVSPEIVADVTAIIGKIESGLSDIEALVKSYNSANSTTTISDIQAAVQAFIQNAQAVETTAGISDPATIAKINEIVQLAVTEIQAWASILPTLTAAVGAKVTLTVPMSKVQYRVAYDTILKTRTGTEAVDAALAQLKKL